MTPQLSRRTLITLAGLSCFAFPTAASAELEWCWDDPPVHAQLPTGKALTVNLMLKIPSRYRRQLRKAVVSADMLGDSASPVLAVHALVPSNSPVSFPVYVTASARRFAAASTNVGQSGETVSLYLPLNVTGNGVSSNDDA